MRRWASAPIACARPSALGVEQGDRVATFAWNTQQHLEAYLGVPAMGAVLHTLNIRLFPEQLAYVVNHARDRVILVDDSLVPILARVLDDMTTVEHFIVMGDGDAGNLPDVLRYEELLAEQARRLRLPRSRRPSGGQPLLHERARPGTPRASSTPTAPCSSTPSESPRPTRSA